MSNNAMIINNNYILTLLDTYVTDYTFVTEITYFHLFIT